MLNHWVISRTCRVPRLRTQCEPPTSHCLKTSPSCPSCLGCDQLGQRSCFEDHAQRERKREREKEGKKKSQLPIEPLWLWHYSHGRFLLLTNLASGAQVALAPAAPSHNQMEELQALESAAEGRVCPITC